MCAYINIPALQLANKSVAHVIQLNIYGILCSDRVGSMNSQEFGKYKFGEWIGSSKKLIITSKMKIGWF